MPYVLCLPLDVMVVRGNNQEQTESDRNDLFQTSVLHAVGRVLESYKYQRVVLQRDPRAALMTSGLWGPAQLPASLNSMTYSSSIIELVAKPLLFASRQNTLILYLCVFIPVLNVPFRTLTLKDPSLHAATNPAV